MPTTVTAAETTATPKLHQSATTAATTAATTTATHSNEQQEEFEA